MGESGCRVYRGRLGRCGERDERLLILLNTHVLLDKTRLLDQHILLYPNTIIQICTSMRTYVTVPTYTTSQCRWKTPKLSYLGLLGIPNDKPFRKYNFACN